MDLSLTILYALPYRMTDEKTGEVTNSGISCYAYEKDNLKPIVKETGSNKQYGRKPMKFNLPFELANKIVSVPGVYSVEAEMQSNKDLQAMLKITDITFEGTLETKLVPPSQK